MREIGIDIGSVSIKVAEFVDGGLVRAEYIIHHGGPYDRLLEILRAVDSGSHLAMTGVVPRAVCDLVGAIRINEIEASAAGVLHYNPAARSIIEIGGEDSKLIIVEDGVKDFFSNSMCAAGAGIFLDQQARRLHFAIEEMGAIALRSRSPARIAGRCSVFAKSDMIHLQQIGTPHEDLVAGLCFALARTFKSVISQGKFIPPPVAFIGGVAGNRGVVKAFRSVLNIGERDLFIPDHYRAAGAIGAVLKARKNRSRGRYEGCRQLEQWLSGPRPISRLPPLNGRKKWQRQIYSAAIVGRSRVYLGIDVGSISTNLVIIDDRGEVRARKYLWTKGRPVETVLEGLKALRAEVGDRVEVAGVGTTGSGRYLIGSLVGADIIKNEISAQARAATEIDPDVDTIFEIGGQDSKFISLRNKAITDFEMNKVCAAGTGSFLEEQAQALDVKLEEFGDLALDAPSPMNLGERCTVFIGSEVIHHQADSEERKNLLAGLGYSIVFNYLNRVVGNKKIGRKIFFQGGVAANKAVVSAFEEVVKQPVHVPPNHDVTGAIGIALLAREAKVPVSQFRGFGLADRALETVSFTCHHCSNECEINQISIAGEKAFFYGGRCERYERRDGKARTAAADFFKRRNEIFFSHGEANGTKIGLPRALINYELFPFFYRFLTTLGFSPVLSDETNRKTVELGAEIASADTCLPVKVAYGHIKNLIDRGVDSIFLPSVITMPPHGRNFSRSYVCPYVQTIPYLVRAVFGGRVRVSAPVIYFDRGTAGVIESLTEFGRRAGKSGKIVAEGLRAGLEYQAEINEKMSEAGREARAGIGETAFVICSRPYNGYDLGLNIDLPKKIRELGVVPIPLDFLPLDYTGLKEDFANMYWHYGQKILAAAEAIGRDDRLFPVYVSNFSCGPDSFITRFFREKTGDKPFLLLEIDEHSGDAGFITRLEAFHDSIQGARRKSRPRKIIARSELRRNRTVYIPAMCDQASVLASAMNYARINAEVLPQPDGASVIIGRQYTSGRECLPAIITAGDMIKKVQSAGFAPERSSFLMPQGSGPCRFGQYYRLQRLILDELGHRDIPVYAPNQGPSLFDDLAGPMGFKFLLGVWDGICAVDALQAVVRKIRPYEKVKGEADTVYNRILKDICRRIEDGRGIVPVLRAATAAFDSVKVSRQNKPRIGIVGEIFVRSQEFSNNFLIRRIEELGAEVVMPSIGEWFFYTNYTRIRNCWWFREYRRSIFTRAFDYYMKRRQNYIYGICRVAEEDSIRRLLDSGEKYIHPSFEGEAILSVGKTAEFIAEGCHGVINVMPFTCMPGNIVATVYRRMKDEFASRPLLVLSVDGADHAVDSMRLETFIDQARDKADSVNAKS